MTDTFVLTPDMLATGRFGVEMRAPTYGDLRKARRLFPFEKAERGERIGYVPDDLLLASLLVSINGQSLGHANDLIERLNILPLADRQALSAILMETFYLSKEQANVAASKARAKRTDPYEYQDIPAADTPTGGLGVRFMVPTSKIQMVCEQRYQGLEKSGVGLEEYMFAYCLMHLNDVDVQGEKDKLSLLDGLEITDIQYATNYFIALSTIDEETRVDVKKYSAAIRQQLQKSPAAFTPVTAKAAPEDSIVAT